ncbi:type IX secretion system membrane protein PorP/SprF [Flagellimonas meridianipacifica]|uniref:Type IX secretion system PorP/SprF family membrane protein n=1 Tax=Flagellimonas meridianipacifica TaxID=1080225 RepID=A0A2T0MA08_9FLAO|nr:type IX secretion system membrane protein PorP/SprF [Allomuricauda pacifica]PRX54308.1 type IX secretion system PorP/SprF family membrane protein [Allomuricauda pacifica]
MVKKLLTPTPHIHRLLLYGLVVLFFTGNSPQFYAQEANPYVSYDVPFQNLLKFNRFLINPTFSTVREDKTYVNLFHRSQGADFNDNRQNYFLSYSGRIKDNIGLGLSLYNQQEGVITNLGVMANYAHGVQLGEKSNLSFGVNIPYYVSSFDADRAVALQDDPVLSEASESAIISFQPGLNLSLGKFDFGVFAQNLLDYDIRTGESLSEFNEKTFSGHIQFAHEFQNGAGVFEDGRLLPLARARFEGSQDPIFGGGLILDLPKLGWLQGGYDQFYGVSAGTGFNLNRRLSFGYNFEKNVNNNLSNLGVTHEVSIAFSFIPTKSAALASNDEQTQKVVQGTFGGDEKEKKKSSKNKLNAKTKLRPSNKEDLAYWEEQVKKLQALQEDNYAVINELIFRLDSLEENRQKEFEQRFELVMRMVKQQTGDKNPNVEEAAKNLYLAKKTDLDSLKKEYSKSSLAENKEPKKEVKGTFNGGAFKPIEKYINLDGVGQGHYIVANVFKNEAYLKRFMQKLKDQGLTANYFKNPENGLNYVYLAKYQENEGAYEAYRSKMDGKYTDEIWIMHVDNPRYSNWAKSQWLDNE